MMHPAFWQETWTADLANHLWQSTAVTGIAWLLSLSLRRNHARMRYWVWMIASIKYLIPFSFLISIGAWLRAALAAPIQRPALEAAMEQITLPFAPTLTPAAVSYAGSPSEAVATAALPFHLWPAILPAIWLCGFLWVLISWLRGWLRIRASIRCSSRMALNAEVPVLSSSLMIEPGVFGILRPVLVLPHGIEGRLTQAQLQAIIDHEICHVRRRDNLTAALHMLVQALFWFHPAVWWIKTRLLEEREQACDELVLQSGNQPEVYAESILNVCTFCIESPLACVAGVTGSDLKRRIVRIMTGNKASNLSWGRKLMLALAATVAIAVPVVFGLVRITQAEAHPAAHGLAGTWQCTLHAGLDLRGVFEISSAAKGGYSGIFYSIDQSATSFPVSSITQDGAAVKISFNEFGAVFQGIQSSDGSSITGTLTQLTFVHPLTLIRVTPQSAWKIPKPQPPMAADADPGIVTASIKASDPKEQARGFVAKEGRLLTANTTLSDLLTYAYDIHPKQLISAPAWIDRDKFDITATYSGQGEPSPRQMQSLVRKLLVERFKISFHRDKRELPVYALSRTNGDPKIVPSTEDPNQPPGLYLRDLGRLKVSNGSMQDLVSVLQSGVLDRPTIDRTRIAGKYDFSLDWTPDDSQFHAIGATIPHPAGSANQPPPLAAAIQRQLGLKLEPTMASVEVIVIDRIERPAELD
jgi:uncharacterized protein (TIGR03435 family)